MTQDAFHNAQVTNVRPSSLLPTLGTRLRPALLHPLAQCEIGFGAFGIVDTWCQYVISSTAPDRSFPLLMTVPFLPFVSPLIHSRRIALPWVMCFCSHFIVTHVFPFLCFPLACSRRW
jgi:hypothetical protein